MVPVRNDVNPEVVITWHGSGIGDVSTPLDMTKRGRMTANCHRALGSPHRSCRLTLRESCRRDIGVGPTCTEKSVTLSGQKIIRVIRGPKNPGNSRFQPLKKKL